MTDQPSVAVLTVVKAGHGPDENEDHGGALVEHDTIRAVVADGATESAFSRQWAEALVASWLETSTALDTDELVEIARRRWRSRIPPRDSLPWFGQAKVDQGSHAALAALTVRTGSIRYEWDAHVVGDCELFVLSGGSHLVRRRSIPFTNHRQFSNQPDLLSTNRAAPWITFSGSVRGPAEMWLVTDAFGQACLRASEEGRAPWRRWRKGLQDHSRFENLVATWRERGWMRNDDVTVVRIILP